MATDDDTDRLAREARAIEAECAHLGANVGALEFHDHPRDRLGARLAQAEAEALLCATVGEPGEGWRRLADGVQENYLWCVWDMVRAARGDLAALDAERRAESP
ncbi:MAG: hypothetical protein ACK59M_10960 [Pseudomonadota bacterium]|jgi:hypothetical protein